MLFLNNKTRLAGFIIFIYTSMYMKKIKTEWDLTLLYKNQKDPQIEADIVAIEKACDSFAKKYENKKSYTTDKKALLESIKDYEKLLDTTGSAKPLIYFHFLKDIKGSDSTLDSALNKLNDRFTKSNNKTLFYMLDLGKIETSLQNDIKKDPVFSNYKYFLELTWLHSKHQLSESEEKILNLKSLTSRGLWVRESQKLLSSQTVMYKGKSMGIAEAVQLVPELPIKESRELNKKVIEVIKNISHFAEAEMNAIVTDKKINDELRGYKNPYSATILGYQNDEKNIEFLIDIVTKYFHLTHRFYKLKAKALNLKSLEAPEIPRSIGKFKKEYSFVESVDLVKKAFGGVKKEYVDIFESYLNNGQIDVYPKKGKKGGAYCWSGYNRPTYVFLNHTNSFNSVTTLAHEMGHAIHGEYSKKQPILYDGHTISVAEVASTLFENFAFEELFKTLSDKEKMIALHDKLQDSVSTIFRQVAAFNFEKELHTRIREEGYLSKENIAKVMRKHLESYIGKAVKITDDDGYIFVRWSHFRRFFYVYSYAYGELVSRALYQKYKEDNTFIEKINEFLSAGESMSPENIFKSIGIDVSHPDFFEGGLKSIEKEIDEFEKLLKQSQSKAKKKTKNN